MLVLFYLFLQILVSHVFVQLGGLLELGSDVLSKKGLLGARHLGLGLLLLGLLVGLHHVVQLLVEAEGTSVLGQIKFADVENVSEFSYVACVCPGA